MTDDWDLPAPGQTTIEQVLGGAPSGGLFGEDEQFHRAWQHWEGMPEFVMEDQQPDSEVVVKFRRPEDRKAFAELIGQPIERWRAGAGLWWPPIEIGHYWDKRYRDAEAKA